MYAALTKKNGGHSFLFTGINTEGLVWVNWGWSGLSDGWYAIDQLKPNANLDFCVSHQMIIGFKPQPEPDKDEENKSFGVLARKRILPSGVQIRMQRYSNLFYIIFAGGISTDVSIW